MSAYLNLIFILLTTPDLLPTNSPMKPAANDSKSEQLTGIDASQCPILFGDERLHDFNKSIRKENLVSIRQYKHATVIVHHTNWNEPTYLGFSGITLVDTNYNDDSKPAAYIEVSQDLDRFECQPGLYKITVDDCIGGNAKVIAILNEVILLESEDKLRYMTHDPSTPKPLWQMVWASPWKIIKTRDSNVSSPIPTSRQPPRQRQPRHRSRRPRE